MPSTLSDFTSAAVAAPDDFIVGYDTATLNGERRWTLSTIANAVSGIMQPALQSLVTQQTITLAAPTGTVAYFASQTAPLGWEDCDGAVITTALGASYTAIRNYLIAGGSKFGSSGADPRLPNLHGQFIRSFDTTGLIDNITVDGAIALNAAIITGLDATSEIPFLTIGDRILTCDRAELLGAVITAIGTTTVTIDKTATAADAALNVTFARGFGNKQVDTFEKHDHQASAEIKGGTTAGANFFAANTNGITPRAGNGVTNTVTIENAGYRTETRPKNIALLACIKL